MGNKLIGIIEKYKSEIFDDKIHINPSFPKQKLKNAIESYANLSKDETPLILIDETVFSSSKEGVLITDKTIYFKNQLEEPDFFHLQDIEYVTLKKGLFGNKININNVIIEFTQPKKQSIVLIVEILKEILENLPKDFNYYLSEGKEKLELEKYEEAIYNFDEALKLKPDAYTYSIRAVSKCELDKYHEAIKDYDESLKLETDANIYFLRGLTKLELKRYYDAIKDFDKSLKLNPNDKEVNIKKKIAEEQLNKYNEELRKNRKTKNKSTKDINLFIKDNVKNIGSSIYVTPDIPEKKLNNAIKAFSCEDFYESILAIYDDTIFGSAKEGFVFTGKKMIHHKYGEFIYSDIDTVEYIENVTVNDSGKEKKDEFIIIKTKDKTKHKLTYGLTTIDKKKFTKFLNIIITEFKDYKEENQLKTISEMPNELKIAYLKIIINMTFIDDEEIDEKELAELFLLMTRLELDKDARFKVRIYITEISKENIESIEYLLEIIKNNSEISHYQSLMISLAKDLINIYFSTKDTTNRNFKFLDENKNLFELSEEEVDLAYDTVENDYKLLKEDLDDNAIKQNAKELASKAAAAGVPLAAVYISGSVIGMSAAGITSGLATLGLGMGMTGGLAVIGLIGVLSYKGVKHLTGANELDKYKTRELMLHDVIKQTQKTTSLIIEDINYLVKKLSQIMSSHNDLKNENENIIHLLIMRNAVNKKMQKELTLFQGALKRTDEKSNQYQNSAYRLNCPKILNIERLKSLTDEPTKRQLYDIIIENYERKKVKIDNEVIEQFELKGNILTKNLDEMVEIFKALGYFEVTNIVTSKIKGIFG